MIFTALVIHGEEAEESASDAKKGKRPPLERLDEHRYRLGKVELNKKEKTLRFPASLHMREELIEYAVVHQTGKVHESLLITKVRPHTIHLAALLLGAKEAEIIKPKTEDDTDTDTNTNARNGNAKKGGVSRAGQIRDPKARTFTGDSVTVWVEWGEDTKRARLEHWIRNEADEAVMEEQGWIYNSSRFLYGHFMAQREGSIIAIISDPNALINSSRPDRTNDEIWRPNKNAVPPRKTEVSVMIEMQDPGNEE